MDTWTVVVWTSRLKEQVVLAVTCLLAQISEQTNKQLLYSVRDTRRYLSGLVRPHCVALVAIYTNIQISVGWFFGLGSLQMMVTYTRVLLATGTHLWTMFASKSLCRSLYSVSTCS